MLKHTSAVSGPTANGHLCGSVNAPLTPTSLTSPMTSSGIAVSTTVPRAIHLRPQQPLNISTLNTSTMQTSTTSTTCTTLKGGTCVVSMATPPPPPPPATTTLLNIVASPGIGANNHVYTNQPMVVASCINNGTTSSSHNNISNVNNRCLTAPNNNNYTNFNNLTGLLINQSKHAPGPREALTSLGLLCLVSLLFALLSLIFLLKISPNSREESLLRSASSEDYIIVYDVTVALCALSLSLNLCCLLVCAIQFLFAVKLVRSPMFDGRDNKYLEKSSASRTCAMGGFFISIPIFLTGIILYTFNHFHSTPAILTSVLIGIGIVFCGGAMVHNVFIWQKEKTVSYRSPPLNMSLLSRTPHHMSSVGVPPVHFPNSSFHAPYTQSNILTLHQPNPYHSTNHINLQPTSVTPVSPNHSHGSFNPLICASTSGPINSTILMRPSTATPPTPKLMNGTCLGGREATGSVSPGLPSKLDLSNITNTPLHELSTLV